MSRNTVIGGISGQDLGIGIRLDVKLGVVSDECALICNACTALIEAWPAVAKVVTQRR